VGWLREVRKGAAPITRRKIDKISSLSNIGKGEGIARLQRKEERDEDPQEMEFKKNSEPGTIHLTSRSEDVRKKESALYLKLEKKKKI